MSSWGNEEYIAEIEKLKGVLAFNSGMIYGWASRLEKLTVDEFGKHNVETFRLLEDMKEQAERLAELGGVDMERLVGKKVKK